MMKEKNEIKSQETTEKKKSNPKKKKGCLTAIFLVFVIGLIGMAINSCGGGSNQTSQSPSTSAQATATPSPSSSNNDNANPSQDEISEFNDSIQRKQSGDYANIILNVQPMDGDYTTLIVTVSSDIASLNSEQKQEVADSICSAVQTSATGTYYSPSSSTDRPFIVENYPSGTEFARTKITDSQSMKVEN